MIRRALIPLSMAVLATAADRLPIGAPLPTVSGESLAGKPLELPAAAAGNPAVLVFSFAKAASNDSRLWNERLGKELGSASPVNVFRVIELESAPRLFRGMATSGIKSGLPKPLWEKTLVLYKDEDLWKQRLAVVSDKHSYLVVLDAAGRVQWMSAGAFHEAGFAELKKALGR